ncbi:SDR family oxidoreductase [Nocardioides sp. TF02-7]|uniref:SDR family oxidoreductase n=1 Tax=Nocardioides sp. TF02-7 TaxID=2917724 RepID=UPI001F05492B|nr:SDR family oxidoreductase [Nocardioides sp. TF02-7]UMG94049.1 SDR family oxidoreductase [Nocardioides sp. TF02-7]
MAKTILVTGASSGLGAEMARQLAAKGHDLALCARRTERLEELRAEIESAHGGRVAVRSLDVTDHAAVFETFRSFRDELGRLDRVVVNAGLGKGARLGTGRFDANLETAMTNFVGALAQTEATMEIFRAQEAGHLVMVSSMSAMRGMPSSMTTYAATKAAVAHLAEGLRTELHGSRLHGKVKVTVLYPGYIRSEMNEQVEQSTPLMVSTEKGVRGDGRRHGEGGRRRVRAAAAVVGAGAGDEARAAARAQAADLRRYGRRRRR